MVFTEKNHTGYFLYLTNNLHGLPSVHECLHLVIKVQLNLQAVDPWLVDNAKWLRWYRSAVLSLPYKVKFVKFTELGWTMNC